MGNSLKPDTETCDMKPKVKTIPNYITIHIPIKVCMLFMHNSYKIYISPFDLDVANIEHAICMLHE